MDAKTLFERVFTLSRVAEISRMHRCHEEPRNVSFSCDWAEGSGVAFEPFKGVQFGFAVQSLLHGKRFPIFVVNPPCWYALLSLQAKHI